MPATMPVELAALVNPLEVFGEVLAETLANATSLAGEVANPGPVLQLIATQAANLTDPAALLELVTNLTDPGGMLANVNDLAAGVNELLNNTLTALSGPAVQGLIQQVIQAVLEGDLSFALSRTLVTIPLTVLLPSIGVIPQITESLGDLVPPARNLLTTLGGSQFVLGVAFPALNTVFSSATMIGDAADELIAAVQAGDLEGVVNAVVTGTATVIDAVQTALLSPTEGLPAALLGAINVLGQPPTTTATVSTLSAEAAGPEALPAGGPTFELSVAGTDGEAATDSDSDSEATDVETDSAAEGSEGTGARDAAHEHDAADGKSGEDGSGTGSESDEDGAGEEAGDTDTDNEDGNGGTDLSDGNKVEPGENGAPAGNTDDTNTETGSDEDSGDSETTTDDDGTANAGSDNDSGSGEGDGSGGDGSGDSE